jgi:hypothetical protein
VFLCAALLPLLQSVWQNVMRMTTPFSSLRKLCQKDKERKLTLSSV